jgi:uncharacterized protein
MILAQVKDIREKLAAFFSQRPEIRFAYLFGSLAKGTQNRLSDLDVAVFVDYRLVKPESCPYGYKASLITELMQLLQLNEVDVVILNESPPLLRYEVVRYGVPLYEVNRAERISFQASTFSRYFDLAPFLKVSQSRPVF